MKDTRLIIIGIGIYVGCMLIMITSVSVNNISLSTNYHELVDDVFSITVFFSGISFFLIILGCCGYDIVRKVRKVRRA